MSRPRRRRLWSTVLASLLILGFIGSAYLAIMRRAHANELPAAAKTTTTKQLPTASAAELAAMGQQINTVIAAHPDMQISVAITDLRTDQSYHYGVADGYIAASTAKLITATLFLHDVETGTYSLDTPINGTTANDALQQLIVNSDNDAWQAFNNLLGHPALETWAGQIGLTNYNADANILTADDINVLMAKLYQHKLLDSDHTQLLLGFMKNANETEYIESSVPAGVKVYHKAGYLDDRVHDAAIIDDGKNPYVLVIFSKANSGTYDSTVGQMIFHDITLATVHTFIKG